MMTAMRREYERRHRLSVAARDAYRLLRVGGTADEVEAARRHAIRAARRDAAAYRACLQASAATT